MSDDGPYPWCHECDGYSVPKDDGTCGECGSEVKMIDEPPRRELDGEELYAYRRRFL